MIPAWLLPPVALALTLTVETPLAVLLGMRRKSDVLLVAMANCVTNPVLNFALTVIGAVNKEPAVYVAATLAGEALVILSEGWFFRRFLEEPPRRPLLCSLILNAASFLTGAALWPLLYGYR